MSDNIAGKNDVVVGVDGAGGGVAALRYAVDEARRVDGSVHAVHVLPDYAPSAYPLPLPDLIESGRTVLRSSVEQAGPLDPEVTVRTELRRGSRAAALVAEARGARLLVVGSDRRSVLQRVLTGNTSTRVAASSVAPVVVVPEGWTPNEGGVGVVLAGVKRTDRTTDLLAEAFALAHERGSRLVLLHVWQLAAEYDGVLDRDAVDEWSARAREELSEAARDWQLSYPDVVVDIRVVHGQPARELVTASAGADELVLVRRAHGFPAAVHLGSTGRAVLRESASPVRVVAPGYAAMVPGLVLENEGAART